ncbi:MAG: DUF3857 domain-containing transglutaminase family protein [Candidatus Krumholzibacteria bacterium]|nr:DUF3857 domain-containing transglutaminase family protein [Candidatus Krumholzibacteria bacterium]
MQNHFMSILFSGGRFAPSRRRPFRQGTVLLAAAALLAQFTLCAGLFAQSGGSPAGGAPPPGERPAADVFSRVADAGTASDHGGAPYVIVYDCAKNKVKPTGVTYVDRYTIYKALDSAGCRDLSVLRWNYDPQSSHVEIREVNVIRGGAKIAVDVSLVHDLPAPQAAIYWSDRIKTLQLPRLYPGDGIEVTIFRKGFTYALLSTENGGSGAGARENTGTPGEAGARSNIDHAQGTGTASAQAPGDEKYIPPMPGEYFDIAIFADEAPMIEKRYVLILPPDKRLHSEIYNGPLYSSTSYTAEANEYAWWGLNLPASVHERFQPDQSDFAPKVVMATVESWEAKSRWFFDVNRNQFDVTPEISAKVSEILSEAGLSGASDERKAKALLHWVAQNIRYSGQTMGPGEGFILHPGSMILEQRSGVCKDIAGMLITMLRAAGLDSYAAMTMAGSRIDAVPADQFNHCVCALRLGDGSFRMYDPTWVPFNNNIWSLLEAEQHYLVGTPEGEPLARIAYSPPEQSPLKVRHDAALGEDGTLEGTFRFEGSGAMDSRLRGIVAGSRIDEMANSFAALIAPAGERVEAVRYKFHGPDDFSADMWLEISYRIPRFAAIVDGGLEFRSPAMQVVLGNARLFRAASAPLPAERKTDLFLYYTQLFDGSETIRLPKGYGATAPRSGGGRSRPAGTRDSRRRSTRLGAGAGRHSAR